MKIAWVLGWATPAEWFASEAARVWPEATHLCVPAAPDWRRRLESLGPCGAIGGYSLGSLLLLEAREWAAARAVRVGLLAPIWAFPAEAARGGRVSRTQVRALARWLRRDAAGATADFYARAGLNAVAGKLEPLETLLWGLEELESNEAAPGLPAGWRAFAGAADPLLDAEAQAREAAGGLTRVPGAGHAPGALLAAWAAELRRA